MSRRDVVVNTLLGTILLSILFAYFAAIGLMFLFGFVGLDWIVRRVFAGMTLPAGFSFLVIWALIAVWSSIGHARKGHWRNVFLVFVSVPLLGFAWFALLPSSIGGYGHAGLWGLPTLRWFPVFIVFGTSGDANLDRLRFFLAAAVAAASVAVNSGLLGNGALARTVASCILVAAAAWMIDGVWKGWRRSTLDQSLALPPAGA
jgi:hypothetical protein